MQVVVARRRLPLYDHKVVYGGVVAVLLDVRGVVLLRSRARHFVFQMLRTQQIRIKINIHIHGMAILSLFILYRIANPDGARLLLLILPIDSTHDVLVKLLNMNIKRRLLRRWTANRSLNQVAVPRHPASGRQLRGAHLNT